MESPKWLVAGVVLATVVAVAPPSIAQEKLKAVATFSILADFVKNVGGDSVEVKSLVGPNGNSHVYTPKPADAHTLADAQVISARYAHLVIAVRRRSSLWGCAAAEVICSF